MASKKKESVGIDFNALNNYIENDGSSRLYLLYGDEEYDIDCAVRSLKAKYIAEGCEDMDFVRLEGLSWDSIKANINTPPWMSVRKIVYVKDCPIFSGDNAEEASRVFSDLPDYLVLIIATEKIEGRKTKLLNAFKDNGIVANLGRLTEKDLCGYAMKVLWENGIGIDEPSCLSLVNRASLYKRALHNEIYKISTYCSVKGIKRIDTDLLERMCPPDLQGTIFDITDAIGNKDAGRAMSYVLKLTESGAESYYIRLMIGKHLRLLIASSEIGNDRELASRLSLHPFRAQKMTQQARKFDRDRLIGLYLRCSEDELACREINADSMTLLENYIIMACT